MSTSHTPAKSFIETQFPVSKLSKESYKERKANHGQTLTGLGKWWGRKPLVLVRACIFGLLMPASDNPTRDREVFLKLMTMDEDGLWLRYVAKGMPLKQAEVWEQLEPSERILYFDELEPKFRRGLSKVEKEQAHRLAFSRLNYDDKLEQSVRPEDISGPSVEAWVEINEHLETSASNLQELVAELGCRRFGRTPRVGDAFCGGGSIPFEAARLGCEAYGSDLNPVAALLTWAAINIVGGGEDVASGVREALGRVFEKVKQQVDEWGIERHELGWEADGYLYCSEVLDPETGWTVPLSPSWMIAERSRAIAELVPQAGSKSFDILIRQAVSEEELKLAKASGTWDDGVRCPVDRQGHPLKSIERMKTRADDLRGPTGLRRWENDDVVPRPTDVFQERLYCIKWRIPTLERLLCAEQLLKVGESAPGISMSLSQVEGTLEIVQLLMSADDRHFAETARSTSWRAAAAGILRAFEGFGDIDEDDEDSAELVKDLRRDLAEARKLLPKALADLAKVAKRAPKYLYRAPDAGDRLREERVLTMLRERFAEWQRKGFIPALRIEPGAETTRLGRERGYAYWHHLFNPRQLLQLGMFASASGEQKLRPAEAVACTLSVGRLANWNSKLCRWLSDKANEKGADTYSNQALNTLLNYSCRPLSKVGTAWFFQFGNSSVNRDSRVECQDARNIGTECDLWITDPPYADAVNYHELSEFFLAWYAPIGKSELFGWHSDSRRALAVKGSDHEFKRAMVDCYGTMASRTSVAGSHMVMFTHTSAEVWADLALILWASGLHVVSAWTIATETDASGLKSGNYVQGTVNLVLRNRVENRTAWRSDVLPEIQDEVQRQLDSMLALEDADDPNFTDSDLQLAAYAAALRVLTQYARIEDLDVGKELARLQPQPNVVRERKPEKNPIVELIDEAVKIASDYLVPAGLDRQLWRSLQPLERLYVKGLEVERHGDYRNGVYMEFARGFGVRDYKPILADSKANQTRLKTATEFGSRDLRGGDFGDTLLRQILFAVHKTAQEDDPRPGRDWLRQEVPQYWNVRQNIVGLLHYLAHTPTAAMEHWDKDAAAAELLRGMVENDSV